MTREEAINNLNMINIAFVEPVTKEQRKLINDTFDEAIKALVELPKRRKEAKRWRTKAHEQAKECEYLKSAIRISKNMPKEMVEKVFFDVQEVEE